MGAALVEEDAVAALLNKGRPIPFVETMIKTMAKVEAQHGKQKKRTLTLHRGGGAKSIQYT